MMDEGLRASLLEKDILDTAEGAAAAINAHVARAKEKLAAGDIQGAGAALERVERIANAIEEVRTAVAEHREEEELRG